MPDHNAQLRQRLAYEAARILADQGDHDFARARRKAAQRLGCRNQRHWPDNLEIEQALQQYQQLFRRHSQGPALRRLREAALEAMDNLAGFRPRLAGPVLQGTADAHSPIEIHLFCDTPEEVAMALLDSRIPWEDADKKVRFSNGEQTLQPVFRLNAGANKIELVWFSLKGLQLAPLSPLDHKPEPRANAARLRELLAEET